uniref:Uncharacterized protein n=1 Tax=Heterorhabditis bacteriophora TaxID=37862 RepID=A0A1I7W943_HETBA
MFRIIVKDQIPPSTIIPYFTNYDIFSIDFLNSDVYEFSYFSLSLKYYVLLSFFGNDSINKISGIFHSISVYLITYNYLYYL